MDDIRSNEVVRRRKEPGKNNKKPAIGKPVLTYTVSVSCKYSKKPFCTSMLCRLWLLAMLLKLRMVHVMLARSV